ncbi:unnamed protein product [Gongylonema pulchrum]|uniref:DDE_Tnp_ISL3 domain-containing protein n=1 Tax=Gongylonema pulchrum TaxID=637853 RepID=A0A183DTF4_9BILA|nr:unnamed protein product [Gongylonema pulchrum]
MMDPSRISSSGVVVKFQVVVVENFRAVSQLSWSFEGCALLNTINLAKDAVDKYQQYQKLKKVYDGFQMIDEGYQKIKGGFQVREGIGMAAAGINKIYKVGKRLFS